MTPIEEENHARFMRIALNLAKRGLGIVAPNPAVGCVIVKNEQIVGRGWTQRGGRPHAETEALARAGEAARGSTAYVTLEPCAHQGVTPPCASALIESGVERVVVAVADPDPRVNGGGVKMLKEAGIRVISGICGDEASRLNRGFFLALKNRRPLVTVKIASSLDGFVSTKNGESKWITGEQSRDRGQLYRANHDAILVGGGTAILDDPALTCRLPGMEDRSPIRVVVVGERMPSLDSQLVKTAQDFPVWFLITSNIKEKNEEYCTKLVESGVRIFTLGFNHSGRMDLEGILEKLAEAGITRLLVEGGPSVITSLISADLVDQLVWFRAPVIIGGDGRSAISDLGLENLDQAKRFKRSSFRQMGNDVIECLERWS